MTDRDLLEAAAKAADIVTRQGDRHQAGMLFRAVAGHDGKVTGVEWNPLADDGDALRLAVRLRLDIEWRNDGRLSASKTPHRNEEGRRVFESSREDAAENLRRAIVRAAAAMAKETA